MNKDERALIGDKSNTCGTCRFWVKDSHNHGSFIFGNCYCPKNDSWQRFYDVVTEYDNHCENYEIKNDP